jgi:hypothetical protein
MQKLTAVASFVVAAFLATSCSDTDARVTATGPTSLTSQSATFQSATLDVTVPGAVSQTGRMVSCPASPPFTALVNLSVRAGDVRVTVVEISLLFVDASGVRAPQVTLPAPVMTTQFGSALIEARSSRTFPLTLGLGCGTAPRGTVTVIVVTRDAGGRVTTGQVSTTLR